MFVCPPKYNTKRNHRVSMNEIDLRKSKHYTIIDFNEVDMRIYLPKKWYSPRPQGQG